MAHNHSKGKVGPDGVTRYYVPSQHAWLTRKQIEEQNKAAEQADKVASIVMPIVLGGAFLFMIIVTISSL
jgi:hypothetical protein